MKSTVTLDTTLPCWESLCAPFYGPSVDGRVLTTVEKLKAKGPNRRFKIAKFILSRIMREPCYTKFVRCTWDEAIEVTSEQWALNLRLPIDEPQRSLSHPLAKRASRSWFRPFSQMPCTSATAARRVAKVESLVPHDSPVLILGDDDLVSIELARRGFQDVTALDIDPKVLAEIRQAAQQSDLNITCVEQDLQKPLPQHLKRDYSIVLFDSEYSLEGISLFLKAGLSLTERRSGTLFFVSVHLMSLFREGISGLDAFLSSEGLEIVEFNQGFNVYPTPRRLKGLIRLWNRIVIGSSTLTTEGHTFPFLLSDALLLRKL